jgi:hypothetical protein
MSLDSYQLRKRKEPKKETEQKQEQTEDDQLLAELDKIAVSPKLAQQWTANPCARPC